MYLNIPVKLENYVSVIKDQTRFIKSHDKITLLKLGTTTDEETSKLMYLIYNPFPITMTFDCNSFLPLGRVYKTYPASIKVSPKTAYAFIAFVSGIDEITLNESNILDSLRINISSRVLKLNKPEVNDFEETRMHEIDIDQIDINQTMKLDSFIPQPEEEINYINYTTKYDSDIVVALDSYDHVDDRIKLNVKFENRSVNTNLKMRGFRLKMEDVASKVIISAREEFSVKARSTKIVSVYINSSQFDNVKLENMKLKITII